MLEDRDWNTSPENVGTTRKVEGRPVGGLVGGTGTDLVRVYCRRETGHRGRDWGVGPLPVCGRSWGPVGWSRVDRSDEVSVRTGRPRYRDLR